MKNVIFACSVAIVLAGCATQAQNADVAIRTNTESAAVQLKACIAAVHASPEYVVVQAKLPLDINQASLQQLTDTSIASDSEIAALEALHQKSQACQKAFLDQISNTTPTIVPLIADAETSNENSLIDLIQQKQTWGAHVRRGKQIAADLQKQLVAESQKINGQLAQSNQSELDRRRAAFAAMARYYQTQQIINNMNRPVTSQTTCNAFGNTVNCIGTAQ